MKIEASIGEVFDKISILSIKLKKVIDKQAYSNILKEYNMLVECLKNSHESDPLYKSLKSINLELWEVEDKIRIHEKNEDFKDEFINLARSVYKLNDKRAAIKKLINLKYNSSIIEEKLY